MKISTLVGILLFTSFSSLEAAPFHTDNIVLKNFQAIPAAGGAKIIWEFTSEESNVICHLEKSMDGINFEAIRTMVLASTRQQALHSVVDKQATGEVFYRLRITKESYLPYFSPIVSVTVKGDYLPSPDDPGMALAAHPIFGTLVLEEEKMSLQVVDLNGKNKISQSATGNELDRNFRPLFSRLPSGYYVLRVNDAQNKPLLSKMIYKF